MRIPYKLFDLNMINTLNGCTNTKCCYSAKALLLMPVTAMKVGVMTNYSAASDDEAGPMITSGFELRDF